MAQNARESKLIFMIEYQLFLGIPLEGDLLSLYGSLNPKLLELFLGDYLRTVTFQKREFLGKAMGMVSTLPQIELSEAHLRSLLSKLFPQYPVHNFPLYLIPIPHTEHEL